MKNAKTTPWTEPVLICSIWDPSGKRVKGYEAWCQCGWSTELIESMKEAHRQAEAHLAEAHPEPGAKLAQSC